MTSTKTTPRVEALNKLLTWVEDKEKRHFEDPSAGQDLDIEDRVAAFIAYACGNVMASLCPNSDEIPASQVYTAVLGAVVDLFKALGINDQRLVEKIFSVALHACISRLLNFPISDEFDRDRELVMDNVTQYFNTRLADFLPK